MSLLQKIGKVNIMKCVNKHKILLCLLTNHRIDRLRRLIKSVLELEPSKLVEIEPVIVVNTLNDSFYEEVLNTNFPFKIIRTESNGKPGKGKNSCRDLFLKSDSDFLCQIDGDDWLYPTFTKSMAQHIEHYPNLDVLGQCTVDLVAKTKRGGHHFKVGDQNQYWGCVWGISLFEKKKHGPGKGHWVDHEYPSNFDRIMLQSKLSAPERMDEDLPNGEDHLYSIQLLKLHQERKIRYFVTPSSDFYISEATLDDNIQSNYPFKEHVETMKKNMLKYVNIHRSSQEELPVIWNNLLLGQKQKEEYIKKTFNC